MLSFNEVDFVKKIHPVYKAISLVKQDSLTQNKSTIGFVGAPWTLLVYMINKQSPKQKLVDNFFDNKESNKQNLNNFRKIFKNPY